MPFDVDFLASFANSGGGGPTDPGNTFEQMTFSDPPTLAELERLHRERWHTRPDWWIDGTQPKIVGVDPLPSGATYNAVDNRISIPNGVTIADFSGWDFMETQTTIALFGNARIINFTNNRMAPRYTTKINRITHIQGTPPPVCVQFEVNQTAQIDLISRCWFTQHPLHEGIGGPGSFIRAQTNTGTNYAHVGILEFCSFEGYDADALKGSWGGIRRYNYIDPARNMPNDATEWDPAATYNRNDVIWGNESTKRIRVCLNNGVTSAPNFSGTLTSTSDWLAVDPHSDCDQPTATPEGIEVEWLGSVFNRQCFNRRFPSRQWNRGVVASLNYFGNTGSFFNLGPMNVRNCLFTDELEIAFSNSYSINFPEAAKSYSPATPKLAEGNWYQTRLTNSSGPHITVQNNVSGWTFPAPATITEISAAHVGSSLAMGFRPSLGGWMRLVVTSSATPMTAVEIINARDGDSGILALGEIDAQTDTVAFGTTPLTLSTGQTVYVHALYQAGGGSDTLLPVITVMEGASMATDLLISELEFDGYVFDGTDQTSASVTLTGTGPAGAKIQVRGESAGGNTAWTLGLVGQDETWAVTVDVDQADWGNWYTPVVRLGSDDTTKVSGTNTFGCGHVVGLLGQSEYVHWLTTSSYRNQLTRELTTENLTVVLADLDDGTDITTARITAGNLTDANVGTLAAANAFRQIVGDDRKLMLVDLAHQGTTPFSLWDDADTGRNWSTMAALVAKARASGSEFGRIIMNWYNAPAASIPTMLEDWAPGMFGQLAGGGAFTLGNTNIDGATQTGPVDHCLWDIEAAPGEQGRGLFARDRTKLHLMLPMPMNDTTGSNSAFDESKRVSNDARASVLTFAADSRVQSFLDVVGPGAHLADFDENNTTTSQSTHPNRLDALGIPWFACQQVPGMVRAAGIDLQEPQITGVTQVNTTTVDVTVSLPNGGNLTTLAGLGAGNHPGTTTQANIPHLQDVIGFQIDRSADTKRPVFNGTGGAAEPALYRGTVTISDSGTGAGAGRSGTVRIVFDQPIVAGDQLTYLDGQANAVLDEVRDETARLYNFMLLEHVPGWSDAGSLYPYHGIPVRPQTPMAAFS